MNPEPRITPEARCGLRAVAQPVAAPLTRAAIFLVVTVCPGVDNRATLRSFCGDLARYCARWDFAILKGAFPAS